MIAIILCNTRRATPRPRPVSSAQHPVPSSRTDGSHIGADAQAQAQARAKARAKAKAKAKAKARARARAKAKAKSPAKQWMMLPAGCWLLAADPVESHVHPQVFLYYCTRSGTPPHLFDLPPLPSMRLLIPCCTTCTTYYFLPPRHYYVKHPVERNDADPGEVMD
jgi:hypothetical protein